MINAPVDIRPLMVVEALEIAQAIYTGDMETLNGWADYFVDESAEALTAAGRDVSIIADFIITDD